MSNVGQLKKKLLFSQENLAHLWTIVSSKMRNYSLTSFMNLYKATLRRLHVCFYEQNKKRTKSICRNLLKRTIFFALFLSFLSQKSHLRGVKRKFSNTSDFLLTSHKFSNFKKISDFFFPLDERKIEVLGKTEKVLINSVLKKFIKSFSWESTLNMSNTTKENTITSEIFELIYQSENSSERGVVFTPFPFSYWMVQSCFQRYLAMFLNQAHFSLNDLDSMEAKKIELLKNHISEIRVLDISVGCGTFYLASLRYLLMLNNRLGKIGKNSLASLKNILIKNLYGIDIDENALIICKIRLALQILREDPWILAEELLKIVDNINLKTGNTLIGFITNPRNVELCRKNKYHQLLFRDINNTEVKNTTFFNNQKIFHWFLEFPEIFNSSKNSGFEIIIGNPPYIGYRFIDKTVKCVLKHLYPGIYTGLNDYYYYFIWRAKQLLAPNGSCVLIVARYFLEARYALKLRTKLFRSKPGNVDIIIDFREFKIFPKGVNSAILFITNRTQSEQKTCMIVLKNPNLSSQALLQELHFFLENSFQQISRSFHQFVFNQADFIRGKFIPVSSNLKNILKKIEKQCVPLSHVCHIGTGYHSGKDIVFSQNIIKKMGSFYGIINNHHSDIQFPLEAKIIHEIVKTTEILPFRILWNDKYVILTKRGIDINNYPLIKQYLEHFKETLKDRYEVRQNLAKWYEIAQVRNLHLFKARMKIMCPYRARVPRFGLDKNQRYSSIDCTSIVPKDSSSLNIYYILGVLNSELIEFYLYAVAKKLDAQKIELYPKTISNIPLKIPRTEETNILVSKITELTENICTLLETFKFTPTQQQMLLNNGKRGFLEFKDEIQKLRELIDTLDLLVYQLYGLETQREALKREIIPTWIK